MPNNQYKILIIEDDTFLSKLYCKKLSEENFEVIPAFDGEKGLKIAQEDSVNLILLDLMLPKMDGFEVIEKLKKSEKTKDIPIVLLTNLNEKKDIERAFSLGVKDYLIKVHFTPGEVIKKIKEILNRF